MSTHRRATAGRFLPWVALLAFVIGLLLTHSAPAGDIVRYALYVSGGVLLPGFLVHRALRGPGPSLVHDAAMALAVGTMCGLFAWALFSALDLRGALWAWPAVSLLLLAVPSTRADILARPSGHWRAGTSWGLVGVVALTLTHLNGTYFNQNRLPPTDRPIVPDLMWHMGLVAEAKRAIPLGTPQVIGAGRLKYHWFAHADMASASLMTHIDVPTVVLRLWPVTMIVVIMLLVATAAQRVSRSQTAGVVAAAMVGVGAITFPGLALLKYQDSLSPVSPTQLYVMIHLTSAIVLAVPLLRGHEPRRAGTWALLVATLLVIAGSKPTGLPLLIGGSLTALVMALVLRLRWRPFIALTAVAAAAQVPSMLWVAGGDAGSMTKLFAPITVYPFVVSWIGEGPLWWQHPGLLIAHLTDTPGGVLAVLALLAMTLVRQLFLVAPVFSARLRRDPVSWWLAGMGAAGVLVYTVLFHLGRSEYFFALTAQVPTSILAAWWLRTVAEGRRRLVAVAGAAGAVAALAGLLRSHTSQALHVFTDSNLAHRVFAWYGLGFVICMVALVAVGLWRWRSGRRGGGPALAAAVTFVTAFICAALPWSAFHRLPVPQRDAVFWDQSAAAVWVSHHVPEHAVLASNDHCLGPEKPACLSLKFWLSGIGGRRVLVEGWSYTPQSANRPFVHPRLLEFNQSLFSGPTRTTISRAESMGVRWLVATAGQTSVSPRLLHYASVAHRDGVVTVYRLH